ncbi:MAG: aldo/keto reductase [Ignavibacteriales bacterium]|nr:aldo/keto reductase [Ignavibacteriales bacterium]
MELHQFAKYNEKVSRLGFGCWGIGKAMWAGAEDDESMRALGRAIDMGVTLFDTAFVYGNGHSEKLVGAAEKASGKQLFIATKVPSKKMEWPAAESSKFEDSFPANHIIRTTELSLMNLKRDHIDLQQFHVWNDKWAERDEWKEAIYRLKKDGKVRYFGISINDHQPSNGLKAAESGLIDCFQVIFNIFDQSPMDELFPYCKEKNIAILARVPLDEGGLTGTINPGTVFPEGDWRSRYFRDERKKQVKERVDAIWDDVKGENETVAEAALRFIISFNEVTTVIPGMRSERNLLANVATVEKGPLSPALLEQVLKHRWVRNFYQ